MNIPFYKKENPNDCSCAPVCLQMAFAYYDIQKPINEIYRLCESLGETHYTLPWGMCLAAKKLGLHATFISKNPRELLESSIYDISKITAKSIDEIKQIIEPQLQECQTEDRIQLLKWNDNYKQIPERILNEESGIVIPTVWWRTQPHNIVITSWAEDEIQYHDPNADIGNHTMQTDSFFQNWLHEYTDHDLLIIWKVPLEKL